MEVRTQTKTHYWVRATPADFGGTVPQARSGHTAVNIGKSKIVVFGGLLDKRFLNDIYVYDIDNRSWFKPECTGTGSDGQQGPTPRAFHIAVAIDCHMFIFGGRSGNKRLGDFWVLDTDIWQWSELTSFGDLPSSRDFAAASAIGNRKIVMYGGWDGKKWLSDVYVLDTMSLEWEELSVSGALPPPRCGHTATMVEKRLLVYGGRGGGGPIMGDLWALKGLIEGEYTVDMAIDILVLSSLWKEENENPGWTQLKLPGQAPSASCGHTVTSGGPNLLLFGGHGTGGWVNRYDIYYNDCIVLDRVSVQWKRLPTSNERPAARAYHSMTSMGSRYLLFGGFDGKSTYGDLWWLVPEDDLIAKRMEVPPPKAILDRSIPSKENDKFVSKKNEIGRSLVSELREKLNVSISLSHHKLMMDELEDKEFIELASQMVGETTSSDVQMVLGLRNHWKKTSPTSIHLKELSPLLRDYQRLITRHHLEKVGLDSQLVGSTLTKREIYRYYHIRNASQLRMDDIPVLLAEYKELLADVNED